MALMGQLEQHVLCVYVCSEGMLGGSVVSQQSVLHPVLQCNFACFLPHVFLCIFIRITMLWLLQLPHFRQIFEWLHENYCQDNMFN